MPSGLTGGGEGPDRSAPTVLVTLGGAGSSSVPLPGARPRSIIRRTGAQPNYCEIEAPGRFHSFRSVAPDTPVKVFQHYGGASETLFVGRVTGRGGQFDPASEMLTFAALGPRADLARDYVLGQEHLAIEAEGEESATALTDAAIACVTGLPCVFNAGGKGNQLGRFASDILKEADHPVFHPDPRVFGIAEVLWNAAEMLEYIYRQRLRLYRREERGSLEADPATNSVGNPFGSPAEWAAPAELTDYEPYGLSVDGLNLAAAFDKVLATCGYRWWIKPSGIGSEGPYGTLQISLKSFYFALASSLAPSPSGLKAKLPSAKPLYLPAVDDGFLALPAGVGGAATADTAVDGPNLGGSTKANVARGVVNEDYSNVLSGVFCVGAPTRVQLELELVPGWPGHFEESLRAKAGGVTDLEHIESVATKLGEATAGAAWAAPTEESAGLWYSDIGRLFLLDQTGYEVFDEMGDGSGEAANYGGALEEPIVPRPRPFLRALLETVALGGAGAGSKTSRHVKPNRLEIHHPSLEDEGDDGYRGLPDGAWEMEPDRGGIRLLGDILQWPFFDASKVDPTEHPTESPFADKVKLIVAVESDWLLAAAAKAGPDAAVLRRAMIRADREYIDSTRGEDPAGAQLASFASQRLALNAEPIRAATFSLPYIAEHYHPGDWVTKIVGRGLEIVGQIVEARLDYAAQDTHLQLEDVQMFLGDDGDEL